MLQALAFLGIVVYISYTGGWNSVLKDFNRRAGAWLPS